MTTLPSRSRMWAWISPTCSLTSDSMRLLAGEDPGPRLADAGRAERVGRARPAELRLRALARSSSAAPAPTSAETSVASNLPVDGLKRRPGHPAPYVSAARPVSTRSSDRPPGASSHGCLRAALPTAGKERTANYSIRVQTPPPSPRCDDRALQSQPIRLAALGQRDAVEHRIAPRNLVRRQPRGAELPHRQDVQLAASATRRRRRSAGRARGRRAEHARRRRCRGISAGPRSTSSGWTFSPGDVDERRDPAGQDEATAASKRPKSPVRKPPSTKRAVVRASPA